MTLIALVAANLALAGETVHEVQLGGGINGVARADRSVSALTHAGRGPAVSLGWSARGPRTSHVVDVSFTSARLASGPAWDFTQDGRTGTRGFDAAPLADLQYAVGRRIDAGAWTVHVGGTLANHFENVTTNYGFLGMNTYLGVLAAGPWLDVRRTVRKRDQLELQAWSPLLSWVARNPYPVHSGEYIWNTRSNRPLPTIAAYIADGRPQTVNHYQAAHLRLGYALGLTDTLALVARGRVDALHLSVPWPLVEWQYGANLALRGSF